MDKETSNKVNIISKPDKIASFILLLGVLLTPILSLPILNFSPEVPRKFFLMAAVIASLIFWLLARFKEKKIILIKSPALVAGGAFLVLALISTLLSGTVISSLIGLGFEASNYLSLAILFSLMFLMTEYNRTNQKFLNAYLGIFAVFGIAFLFQVIRLAFGNFLPWTIFDNGAVNLFGKWNDLGIFAGLIALSAVVILELFPLKQAKLMRIFMWGALGASLLTLALVNFTTIWIVLAAILFVLYIYHLAFASRHSTTGRKMITTVSVFVLSLIFIFFGQSISYDVQGKAHEGYLSTINRTVSDKLGIASLDVRPSFAGTFSIIKSSLKSDPFFGSGLNNFSVSWLKDKPAGVNESQFWNIEPAFGVGYVPTFFATTGLLGGLALVIFIFLLLYAGVKALLNTKSDQLEKSFLLLSFAGLVYVWSFLIFYVPDTALLVIAFAITGLFVSRLVGMGETKVSEIALTANPKIRFASYLAGSLKGLVFIFLAVVCLTTMMSMIAFQRSTTALQVTGDIVKAERYINLAISLNPQDVYYRLATQINVADMNALLSKKLPQEELVNGYKAIFDKAKKNADAAVEANQNNYLNYVTRGILFENIMALGVDGAYDMAKKDYSQALALNPHGPDMYLNLARLEITNKSYTEAEKYLEKAIGEKKNYIDAIFLQSQLYAQRGFLDSAIKRAQDASSLAPSDTALLFQVGYLKYRNADYRGAIQTLKTATSLVPNFANAKYFLGLSYDKMGQTDSAINEFTEVLKANPDNAEIKQILSNLEAGRDALAGAEPVAKKVAAPVKED